MSNRTWNKKYTKKKTSSQIIDEKIALLDREMRKTKLGESIANSTSGLYTVTGFEPGDPAIPEIPAIPEVPPTYEDVTGGISNPDDFTWPDQGDGSDSDAAVNIPINLYTTYNGQQVAATRYIDTYNGNPLDYGDNPPIGALVFRDGWLGYNYLGYLSGSGIRGVGTTRFPVGDIGNAINAAYNNWTFPGLISKTIYQWGPLDCLFGSCKGASQYYPSNLNTTTTPKADYALYAYTLWIPADADGNPLPNRVMTNAGSAEVPAIPGIPAIPPKQVIISRPDLGDPNYYPGPVPAQGQVAQMGPNQVYPLLDIIRQSPPGPTRNNAIQQLNQWAKPGSKNRDILIKLGVPLEGASLPTQKYGDVAQLRPYGLKPDGTHGYSKPGERVFDPASKKTFELKPGPEGRYQWMKV